MGAIRGWLLRGCRGFAVGREQGLKGAPSMERYTKEQHQAYVEAEERKRQDQEQARKEAHDKDVAKRLWVRDGGTEEAFEAQWKEQRDTRRRRRIEEIDRE